MLYEINAIKLTQNRVVLLYSEYAVNDGFIFDLSLYIIQSQQNQSTQ